MLITKCILNAACKIIKHSFNLLLHLSKGVEIIEILYKANHFTLQNFY